MCQTLMHLAEGAGIPFRIDRGGIKDLLDRRR